MSKSAGYALVASLAWCAAVFGGDLPARWTAWRYTRPITPTVASSPLFCLLSLDAQVFAHSQNRLADLRIIDESGAEVPYTLRVESAHGQKESRPAVLRENSFVPGQYTQAVIDLGKTATFHNAVQVETPKPDFINWVEVAASDDARIWRIVQARAPISRFRRENLDGNQTVRYSPNNARYLRLRIFETARQFPVTGANVYFQSEDSEPTLVPIPATVVVDGSGPTAVTRWGADLLSDGFPVDEVRFQTSQREFYRAVRLQSSEDGKEWTFRCGGEIYRYKAGEKEEESLRVSLCESWGPRHWRVEVVNGDDAPLENVSAHLAMIVRALYFEEKPNHAYRLLYGNERAQAPTYDLSRLVTVEGRANPGAAGMGLGAEEATTNYADPRPFTERHPNLLWLAVGIAVVLLAYAAVRALRA